MPTELLSGEDAVKHIEAAAACNRLVLGVDGVRIVPEGYMASLDLILDVSGKPITVEAAAAATINFIRSNAADDVVFEIVIADAEDDD
jgi:hypothetical protein